MNQHERLVYERDSWYDEYVDDEYIEDDGSIVYADGHVEHVQTAYEKDLKLLEVQ